MVMNPMVESEKNHLEQTEVSKIGNHQPTHFQINSGLKMILPIDQGSGPETSSV